MNKKLPRFSGRINDQEQKDILAENIPIGSNQKIQIPNLEETPEKNKTDDLFKRIKNLFEISKGSEKTITNNYTTNNNSITTKQKSSDYTNNNYKNLIERTHNFFKTSVLASNINNNHKNSSILGSNTNKDIRTNLSSVNSTIIKNTPDNRYDENYTNSQSQKFVSILNSYIGKNPSYKAKTFNIQKNQSSSINNLLEKNNSEKIFKNNISSSPNIQKSNTEPSIKSSNISNIYSYFPSKVNESLNEKQIQSYKDTSEKNTRVLKTNTSVERHPYIIKQKGNNYLYDPVTNESVLSFYEGTQGTEIKGSKKGTQITVGDKNKSEIVKVESKKTNTMSEAAKKIQDSAIENAAKENMQSNLEDQSAPNIEVQQNQSGGGGSNVSITNLTKTMTTFEKVAIETYMIPNWRRVIG